MTNLRRALGAAAMLAVLSVATACGASTAHTARPSPSVTVSPEIAAAGKAYLRMVVPINHAIAKLADATGALNPSLDTIAHACQGVSVAATHFHDAMAAYRWPASVELLSLQMEAAVRGQAAAAHRCYLDDGDQPAMINDVRAFFNPAWHATDRRWRKALGLPPSHTVDGSPTVAS